MIDPVTGQSLNSQEVSEHMRIQLMDPKWREEQRRAAENKDASARYAEGEQIAESLRMFANARDDIFGGSGAPKQTATPALPPASVSDGMSGAESIAGALQRNLPGHETVQPPPPPPTHAPPPMPMQPRAPMLRRGTRDGNANGGEREAWL